MNELTRIYLLSVLPGLVLRDGGFERKDDQKKVGKSLMEKGRWFVKSWQQVRI